MAVDPNPAAVIGTAATLLFLAGASVALRLTSRYIGCIPLGLDDYTILITLVLGIIMTALVILVCHYGIVSRDPPVDSERLMKTIYVLHYFIHSCSTWAKISILLLYNRLFPLWTFTKLLYFLGAFLVTWWVVIIMVIALACHPLSYFWTRYSHPELPGTCMDPMAIQISTSAVNVAIDLTLLLAPMPLIWPLSLPTLQKFCVTAMLILGSFTCIASGLRIAFLVEQDTVTNFTQQMVSYVILTIAEPLLGIICACLPTLRPLFHHGSPRKLSTSRISGGSPQRHSNAAGSWPR